MGKETHTRQLPYCPLPGLPIQAFRAYGNPNQHLEHEDAGIVGVVRAEVGQEPCGVGRSSDQDREEATYLALGVEVTVPTL